MDSTVVPEIFVMTLFIVGFQPLVRRAGAHANLWFLGWFFLLVHEILLWLGGNSLGRGVSLLTLALASTTTMMAVAFLCAAANSTSARASASTPNLKVKPVVYLLWTLPVMVQSVAGTLHDVRPATLAFTSVLFLLPLAQMLFARERRRPLLLTSAVYAAIGLLNWPLLERYPQALLSGVLCALYLITAFLYYRASVPRPTRGLVAALSGLVLAGASYPLHLLLNSLYPGQPVSSALTQLPQYLIVAGISLTLLEEHVLRTERLANYDPLTDLPNRRLFEERLIATMEDARLSRTTVACLVIDVDNFKTINDTLGHSAGDQLLRALAVRLNWHMGPRDILARTGGDEFTALLAGVNDEHHLRFIASAMMSAASVPIIIDSGPVDVRISVGIALSPDHADDIDSLRRAADQAMYSAKRRGGSLLAFAGEE